MKRLHIRNRTWFIIVLMGWTALLVCGAVTVHKNGWHHAARHLFETSSTPH